MSKFTKGEWYVFNNGTYIFVGSSGSVGHICKVGWVKSKEVEANARLIAAAPEMYQHLRLILNEEFSSDDVEQLLARIDGEELTITNRDKLNQLFVKECQEVLAMSDVEIVEKGIWSFQFSQKFCDFLFRLGYKKRTWNKEELLQWLSQEAQV
ncbi:MAG: hypothetical protein IJ859_04740 [Synergistaceae bacterium]|nr:hypothetical protein [Synergistaceae bacterium]